MKKRKAIMARTLMETNVNKAVSIRAMLQRQGSIV